MNKNIFFSDNNENTQTFDWGEVLWLHEPSNVENQRLSAALVKIFSKSKHTSHFHLGEEQLLYVLKGKGLHKVNDQEKDIYEGMIVHCPPYSSHEVINTEDMELILLIVYTPSKLEDIHQNLSIISKHYTLKSVDLEILENIQEEISNLLNLSIVITDEKNKKITEGTYLNCFCTLCAKHKSCEEEDYSSLNQSLNNNHKIFTCYYNVITLSIPIMVNGEIIGYVKCGNLLINKLKDIEEKLLALSKEENIAYEEILEAYESLPIVLKSRLYALIEALTIVAKYITEIIINSMIEKELREKNNQILEKTQEKLYLEDALKQVNLKLLKTQVTSNLKLPRKAEGVFSTIEKIEYPFSMEIGLEKYIQALDENNSIQVVKRIIFYYKDRNISLSKTKNILDEMVAVISRMLYRETDDIEIMSKIREKYKGSIFYSQTYEDLTQCMILFVTEMTDLLRHVLLNGTYNLIEKVNTYINENYYKDLTLNLISNIFYVSPNYLSTLFNEQNKISLTDYINKIRIEKAKEYLKNTELKIAEISKKVGYNNMSYFGYMFKKYIKATPKQYRVENKNLR
ncbi:PocR ligand-binding domain-containing protein [Marinisporobacter balticus]|uniref:AraC family transcriptional regulator n=1 Tax=Marinisporobacter balticus TaxID=2018667 RepID=A0A4R2L2C7_9FIRM|nr:PocR ligand-binding domain-containing protein [Marinisporobacter balticus]TCO78039.1 AraC family transcriptional regulator [Marinisporobacter balticus]